MTSSRPTLGETGMPGVRALSSTTTGRAAPSVREALLSRHSTRAFLPRPVPRTDIERLLTLAATSPSNSNCQPWQVHVLTGRAKEHLTAALVRALGQAARAGEPEYPYQPAPSDWPEPFRTRRGDFGEGLYRDTLAIDRADTARRHAHHARNYDFFGAPVGMILTVSRHPLASALIDAGLFLQALMLAARGIGLDTCPQASLIDYSPVLREQLTIPEDQIVVCGLALGHADPSHPLSHHRTPREPVHSFTTFYGE
jgi:nitroreductase